MRLWGERDNYTSEGGCVIHRFLNNINRFRQAHSEASKQFILSVAENRWYRCFAFVVSIILLARIFDPSIGSVTPSYLARLPAWVMNVAFVLLIPFGVQAFWLQREINLKRYDPAAPQIKAMAKRWTITGWVGVAGVLFIFGFLFSFPESLELFPVWLVASLFTLPFCIAVFSFMRASAIRSGDWSPPEWMPPMNPGDANEVDKSDD